MDVKHLSPWRRLAQEGTTSRTTDNVGRFSSARPWYENYRVKFDYAQQSARRGLVRFRRKWVSRTTDKKPSSGRETVDRQQWEGFLGRGPLGGGHGLTVTRRSWRRGSEVAAESNRNNDLTLLLLLLLLLLRRRTVELVLIGDVRSSCQPCVVITANQSGVVSAFSSNDHPDRAWSGLDCFVNGSWSFV